MTIIRADSFPGAVGAFDSTWTQQSTTVFIRYDGSGNATAGTDKGSWVAAFDNQNIYPADQYSKVIIGAAPQTNFDFLGPTTRASGADGAKNCYEIKTDLSSGAGHTQLNKWVGGGEFAVGSFVVTFVVGDAVELWSVGALHSLYKNGVFVSSFSDPDLVSGSAGLTIFNDTGSGSTPLISSWEGGSISGGAPAAYRRSGT